MSIIDFIKNMTRQYYSILIGFSLYYAIRGIMEKKRRYKLVKGTCYKVFVYYIQEFLSQVIFTISGFIALFIAYYIFTKLDSFNDISAGTAILLIFLFIWGITGLSGTLSYLVISGKLTGLKPTQ